MSLGANITSAITYTWLANSQIISGATGASYTPTSAQIGDTLAVVASFTDPNTPSHTDQVTGVAGTVQANPNFDDWNGIGNWTTNTADWSSGATPTSLQTASVDSGTVTFSTGTVTVAGLTGTSSATLTSAVVL